jgi:hypothetical protein
VDALLADDGDSGMTSIIVSLINVSPSQPENFDRLLRRAAAHCWLERFKAQASRGAFTVTYDRIGETAGAVWEALTKQGPLTFAALMEEVDVPQSLFFMAVGWLSREDKLQFEPADGDYIVRLA